MDNQAIPKFSIPIEKESHGKDLECEIYDLKLFWEIHRSDMTIPHRHTFYQIIWLTRGTGYHYIDFMGYPYEPDTLFFVAKNQVHYFDQTVPSGYIMHFNDSFLETAPDNLDIYLMFNVFNSYNGKSYVTPEGKDLSQFQLLLTLILEEYEKGIAFGRNAVLGYLINSFLILAERIRERFDSQSSRMASKQYIFLKFRTLLEETFKTKISVKAYAEKLEVTTKRLTEICRENAGRTPLEMITDRIVLEAKRYMSHSELNIQQIAYDLGYQDPYYFSRMFKKETGLSPTEFRESLSKYLSQNR